MIGGIIGDMIGSCHEGRKVRFDADGLLVGHERNTVYTPFDEPKELFHDGLTFTDDTVLLLASASAIYKGKTYSDEYLRFFQMFGIGKNEWYKGEGIGYGCLFIDWATREPGEPRRPYYSYGNGSAMRVPPLPYAYSRMIELINKSYESAVCTHNHNEGIKGAQALSMAMWMAMNKATIPEIKDLIEQQFNYSLDFNLDELIKNYVFKPTCQESLPQALWCALEGPDFETVMRRCLLIGGDTDTICCMAGALAEILYGIPKGWEDLARKIMRRDGPYLDDVYVDFVNRYMNKELSDELPSESVGFWGKIKARIFLPKEKAQHKENLC
tara:strand:+ start:2838 stop:3818 length:981 start_codon:yes stop_codon:yes gene_type:complete